jgi:hypothetical protein
MKYLGDSNWFVSYASGYNHSGVRRDATRFDVLIMGEKDFPLLGTAPQVPRNFATITERHRFPRRMGTWKYEVDKCIMTQTSTHPPMGPHSR